MKPISKMSRLVCLLALFGLMQPLILGSMVSIAYADNPSADDLREDLDEQLELEQDSMGEPVEEGGFLQDCIFNIDRVEQCVDRVEEIRDYLLDVGRKIIDWFLEIIKEIRQRSGI